MKQVVCKRIATLAMLTLPLAIASWLPSASQARPAVAGDGQHGSRELWATVDICRSKPKPTIGIRGSMPSDGRPHDVMYMRFQIQYLDQTTKRWTDVPKGGSSSFVALGSADTTRQEGRTFTLAAIPAGAAPYEMRGAVEYQWRRRGHVVRSQTRTTTADHRNAAGAIPPHFSSATCTVS